VFSSSRFLTPHRGWMGLLILFLSAASGCGSSPGVVSGKVTFQGKTVASGTVMVIGSDGLPRYGKIETDGSYQVTDIPAGLVKLTVNSPSPVHDSTKAVTTETRSRGRGQQNPNVPTSDPKLWFEIPAKYGDPNTSGKEATIKGGSNTLNIELE
jgi:hypothetical protein